MSEFFGSGLDVTGADDWERPVVTSLLDTDFYKFLMGNFIRRNYPDAVVEFALINRDPAIRLAEQVDLAALARQLDACRCLRFRKSEIDWLRGTDFYGQSRIFADDYIAFLEAFQLPDYRLSEADGQIVLTTEAPWAEASMWEIPFLTVVGELRHRQVMRRMTRPALAAMYDRAHRKLRAKLERLQSIDDLAIIDFGTRRRHSLPWQDHVVRLARDVLASRFAGTSNCLIAMQHGIAARGTVAHEISMAVAAMAESDADLRRAPYTACAQWQDLYRDRLRVCLPDTYGTTQFLEDAPLWLNEWTGFRHDSKDPFEGGEEFIAFWKGRGIDPLEKSIIFSDGLDVHVPGSAPNGEDIARIHAHFRGRTRLAFGIGTNLTNDFRACGPDGSDLRALSLVAKLTRVNGRGAVKLSDNPSKASGPRGERDRYRAVFGTDAAAPPDAGAS